jgi:hypothetical protein
VESVRGYIFNKSFTLFKQQNKQEQLLSMETWDPIFEKINYELRFYSDIQKEKPDEYPTETGINLHTLYPSETYNDYIQRIGSLQRLGAYDYTEFYKKMKDPEFKQRIKQGHEEIEKIKIVKQEIILYVLSRLGHLNLEIEPIETINLIPVFEYISEKNIDCSNLVQEPLYKDFRNNKQQFHEMYTLWSIKNV